HVQLFQLHYTFQAWYYLFNAGRIEPIKRAALANRRVQLIRLSSGQNENGLLMVFDVLKQRFLRLSIGAVRFIHKKDPRNERMAVMLGDARFAKGIVDGRAQTLLRAVHLEVVRPLRSAHGRPATGAIPAWLARVLFVIPTTRAHATNAGSCGLAATVVATGRHAAR